MQIKLATDPDVIKKATDILSVGGLVVFPTETCYGLGADPTNAEAVSKLLDFKGARGSKAVSVAVSNEAMAENYVTVNDMARNVYKTLLPGPVTVVSQSLGKVDPRIEHERKTLGIRIPDHELAAALVAAFQKPITATSANQSGKKPPYSYDDFIKYTSEQKQALVDLFIDAGRLTQHPPSTILDTTLNEPTILRQGEIILTDIPQDIYISNSPEETQDYASKELSKYVDLMESQPLIIALQGDLGAGKTHFVKGVANALDITDTINSPTYTIMHEFDYQLPKVQGTLYHIDTWRLHDAQELVDLGFMDLLKPGNIVAIEWMEKMAERLQELSLQMPILWVTITNKTEMSRLIEIRYQFIR